MVATAFIRFFSCFLLALGLAILSAGPTHAGQSNPFSTSLASELLQSRAQLRIYRHDDQADLACQSRHFIAAKVVRQPRVVNEKLNERKWIERWVLDRCGDHVTYDVYFTEVGEGGAIFTFLEVH
ncbi:MAG TPA: hypothetical protein VGA50_20205 [Kiloniellales bacterium]